MSPNPARIAALAVVAALAALGGALTGCPGSQKGNGKTGDPVQPVTLTLFALAEVRGQIEPCGCTTDPLGDLARTAHLIEDARAAGPVVVVDAGSLLYSKRPVPDHLIPQEELKADLLAKAWTETLKVAAVGLGPMDLARGVEKVRLPRQAANVPATAGVPVEPPRVIEVGGARVGVFGVVSADFAPGIEVTDPVEAARGAVTSLAAERPGLVVALLTMSRKDAVRLLEAVPGIHVAVLGIGRESPEPDAVNARAERFGDAWLVVPANRGQVVPRLTITLRDGGDALVDAVGEPAAAAIGAELDGRIVAMAAEVAGFEADPTADAAFVAQKKQELEALRAERAALAAQPLRVPDRGSYFTLEQVRIKKALACDAGVMAAKLAYSKAAGDANVAAAAGVPVPAPREGEAGYVGVEECDLCHADEVAFWKTTRHTRAWDTLVAAGKHHDYDCTSCHVTGWDQPGGASMAENEPLRDVQCEVCHGPGSIHAEAEDDATARATIRRAPPPELCAQQCHTPEHSDTFQYEAYLRDIVGPGHGGKRRKELGDGPTGRELRAAGLEKAGKLIGAGCVK